MTSKWSKFINENPPDSKKDTCNIVSDALTAILRISHITHCACAHSIIHELGERPGVLSGKTIFQMIDDNSFFEDEILTSEFALIFKEINLEKHLVDRFMTLVRKNIRISVGI